MNKIPYLQAGDRVALAAPARKVSPDEMAPAIATLEAWGLQVVVPEGLYAEEGQLAGSDSHRAALLQGLLDDPEVKAIVCCRGGYGTVRIVDRIDFSRFAEHPKWIVGFSDATVLHSHIHSTLGLPTLHGTMPLSGQWSAVGGRWPEAVESLRRVLFGQAPDYGWTSRHEGRVGEAEGVVAGGNLSILYSLCGSRSQLETLYRIEEQIGARDFLSRQIEGLERRRNLELADALKSASQKPGTPPCAAQGETSLAGSTRTLSMLSVRL